MFKVDEMERVWKWGNFSSYRQRGRFFFFLWSVRLNCILWVIVGYKSIFYREKEKQPLKPQRGKRIISTGTSCWHCCHGYRYLLRSSNHLSPLVTRWTPLQTKYTFWPESRISEQIKSYQRPLEEKKITLRKSSYADHKSVFFSLWKPDKQISFAEIQ